MPPLRKRVWREKRVGLCKTHDSVRRTRRLEVKARQPVAVKRLTVGVRTPAGTPKKKLEWEGK